MGIGPASGYGRAAASTRRIGRHRSSHDSSIDAQPSAQRTSSTLGRCIAGAAVRCAEAPPAACAGRANGAEMRAAIAERGTNSSDEALAAAGRGTSAVSAAPAHRPVTATGWIATSGPTARRSWRLPLFGQAPQRALGFLDVLEAEPARLDQLRHDRVRLAAEERERINDQAALRRLAGH